MKKRVWTMLAIGLISLMTLGLLSACGAGGNGDDDATTETVETTDTEDVGTDDTQDETAGDDTVLHIAVFEGGYGRGFWYDLIDRFEAAHPGVTVEMQISPDIETIIAPQIAVGEFPDFMAIPEQHAGFMTAMIQNRELLDLTDFFDSEALGHPGTSIRDMIIPGMLDSTAYAPYGDGRVYLAPFNASPMGPVYNITLFEEMGWSVPTTWDEFFAMDALLDDADTFVDIGGNEERRAIFTYQGIHAGYLESILWPAIAGAGGMEAIHAIENYEEGAWDNPAVREIIEIFARMGTEGYLMDGTVALDHTQSQADMMLGRALFIPNGVWFVNEMADAPREDGFEFAIAPVPTVAAGQPRYVLSSFEQLSIPAEAANTELALEFLRFFYTDETIISFAEHADGSLAIVGSREVAEDYLSPSVLNMLRAYDEGTFMLMSFAPIPAGLPLHMPQEIFDARMTPLMTGQMTVDQYIQEMEDLNAEIREAIEAEGN
ncbi:MAG: carbohydrate ABC transporter substrate-binding protein [Lachnospiraceae bacterium]|nr:carbohydrate ABC transporter substrate-binding protein [Lachnospiraceae bacterium]